MNSTFSIDSCNSSINITQPTTQLVINGCSNAITISTTVQSIIINGLYNQLQFLLAHSVQSLSINGHYNSVQNINIQNIIINGHNNRVNYTSQPNIINQGFNNLFNNQVMPYSMPVANYSSQANNGAYYNYSYSSNSSTYSYNAPGFSMQFSGPSNMSINMNQFGLNLPFFTNSNINVNAPQTIPAESVYNKVNSNDICTICLENLTIGAKIRVLQCAHIFHKSCIDHWVNESATCPMCKTDYYY